MGLERCISDKLRDGSPAAVGSGTDLEDYWWWLRGFPDGSVVKNLPANAGDTGDSGLIPGSTRSPGGGNGNALQYSCLKSPMDRGAWWAAVHGIAESQTRLSTEVVMQLY